MTSDYPPSARQQHETELESLEKARQPALEVAQEEDAKTKARPENAQAIRVMPPPDGTFRRAV